LEELGASKAACNAFSITVRGTASFKYFRTDRRVSIASNRFISNFGAWNFSGGWYLDVS
jgi:hypothetical protein